MGAGAVAAAGLITLCKTIPTIVSALTQGMKDVRKERGLAGGSRTERDLPIKFLIFGSIGIVVLMWLMLTFRPIPGAQTGMVREYFRGAHRGDVWIFVCDGRIAHQRTDRQ